MSHLRLISITMVAALAALGGCMTARGTREGAMPIAMWSSFGNPSTQPAVAIESSERKFSGWRARECVRQVLADAGVHGTVDESGILVPENEEGRARRALLTDARMLQTDVLVMLLVPAGFGKKTPIGYEVREVAPDGPVVPQPPR